MSLGCRATARHVVRSWWHARRLPRGVAVATYWLLPTFALVIGAVALSAGVTAVQGPPSSEGSQVCYGCRQVRRVIKTDSVRVLSESTSECSRWVAEHVPTHEHGWQSAGC